MPDVSTVSKPYAAALLAAATVLLLAGQASAQDGGKADPLYDGLDRRTVVLAKAMVQEALETAPSRKAARWQDQRTGNSGLITPLRTFKIKTGHYCREFVEAVVVGGALNSTIRTACRDAGGSWRMVKR